MTDTSFPILEFDSSPEAYIEPSKVIRPRDVPEHCVICFFREVLDNVAAQPGTRIAVPNKWEDGPHNVYEIEYQGRRAAFFHPGVGAPIACGVLEEVIAYGCRKFIVCGGAGVLRKDIAVGHLVVVSGAVRDEGTSYHYLPPGREVTAHPAGVAALESVLSRRGLPYLTGKTWTIDAPYRETPAKIAARQREGCLTVEMEASALMAVAQYRGALLGQVLYGGDDLSGSGTEGGAWDSRGWQDRAEIRESLFWLAVEACLEM